jgi:hypothetical protein
MRCINCNSQNRPATEYSLRLDKRKMGQDTVSAMLCELCVADFLTLDWIEICDPRPESESV